ncbi:41914_t:CDS:2, partial [Gigaspora margarita]
RDTQSLSKYPEKEIITMMEEVSEHFARRLNDLDDVCLRDNKKIKTTYANDQNEETERAESSLTLTSNNTKARDQKIASEAMNLSTTTNTNLEVQEKNIEESQQINHMQIHRYVAHNSETMDIEIEDQIS